MVVAVTKREVLCEFANSQECINSGTSHTRASEELDLFWEDGRLMITADICDY